MPLTDQTARELIEALEALKKSNRRIDARIACAILFPQNRPSEPTDFDGQFGYQPGNIKVETGFLMADSFTSSIDAALRLVPEGFGAISLSIDERHQSSARLGHPYVFGNGATPAIALCIAAIKARTALTRAQKEMGDG